MPFWDYGTQCLYLAGKGDGNIRYFEYENDKFEFLSEYKSSDPQRGIAFVPRRGINVHENEVMRAYKTVNDSYIEPISFTVPRRAEVFQSDIYPPATGIRPAVSAAEWLSGKDGIPSKIDLESIYEGNAPVEIPSDYKPPTPAAVPAPAKTPAPVKKEPEPTPVVTQKAPLPTISEQKGSIAAMASKFQDDEGASDDDADETSSFEEISKPVQRSIPAAAKAVPKPASPAKTSSVKASPVSWAVPRPMQAPLASPTPTMIPTSRSISTVGSPAPSNGSIESSLQQIKSLLEAQTKTITTQSEKIGLLTQEVDTLKMRVGSGTQDQSERIRQLELELEAAKS
jgi:coronin-1B/1C/6